MGTPKCLVSRIKQWCSSSEEQKREQKSRGRQHGQRSCFFVKAGGTLTLALSVRERGQPRGIARHYDGRSRPCGSARCGANEERSTQCVCPSTISSAIARPLAGAFRMPQQLWPVAM